MKRNMISAVIMTIVYLLFSNSPVRSQSHPNSIYLELLGNGGLYSINYDRLLSDNVGIRLGLMYLSEASFLFVTAKDITVIPVTLNFFTGGEHKLEFGAGVSMVSVSGADFLGLEKNSGESTAVPTATLGYRYQPADGGFLFRIGFTPIFGPDGVAPLLGISFGSAF